MSTFAILGAGMMGTAMCWPLSDNHHQVRLIGTPLDEDIISSIKQTRFHPTLERYIPEGVQPYSYQELAEAVRGVDIVIGGISSFGIDWFAQAISPWIQPDIPILSVTKGLEDQPNGDLLVFLDVLRTKVLSATTKDISFNAIGGPCTAHELAARRQTAVVFTGRNQSILASLAEQIKTPYYHIWISSDILGVEACAAMKNAYAMGVGLAVGMMEKIGPDGLANLYNPQASLFAQGCFEMTKLLEIIQGGRDNVFWLPGAGDLYVTIFGGRTIRLGKLLGQGVPFSQAREILSGVTLESVEIITRVSRALPKLAERGLAHLDDFPLLLHMYDILNHDAPVNIPWDKFFNNY